MEEETQDNPSSVNEHNTSTEGLHTVVLAILVFWCICISFAIHTQNTRLKDDDKIADHTAEFSCQVDKKLTALLEKLDLDYETPHQTDGGIVPRRHGTYSRIGTFMFYPP